jgi:hypothetical protein
VCADIRQLPIATTAGYGQIYFATRLFAPVMRTGVLHAPRTTCRESWQELLSKYRDMCKVPSMEGPDEDGNETSGYIRVQGTDFLQ